MALYLDHNAGSPLRREACEAMRPWLERGAANPSSLHRAGQAARAALEAAREDLAACLGGLPEEWIFTSGATEACNLGLWGACAAGRPLLLPATEHPAVLETAAGLAARGVGVDILPVDSQGRLELAALEAALARRPRPLLALMLGNNETGVLPPLEPARALLRAAGGLLFCDLAQAAGKLSLDLRELDLDLAAGSGTKFGGPQGTGFLYVKKGLRLEALLRGGHQEQGLRPGTQNVAGALGLAAALQAARSALPGQAAEWKAACGNLEAGLKRLWPGARIHGEGAPRVPNTVCASLPGLERDLALLRLDQLGLQASAGAACAAGANRPSHVLEAMGAPPELLRSTLRFSFGPGQGAAEAARALELLEKALAGMR